MWFSLFQQTQRTIFQQKEYIFQFKLNQIQFSWTRNSYLKWINETLTLGMRVKCEEEETANKWWLSLTVGRWGCATEESLRRQRTVNPRNCGYPQCLQRLCRVLKITSYSAATIYTSDPLPPFSQYSEPLSFRFSGLPNDHVHIEPIYTSISAMRW